jgi:hypothetical protein
MYRLHSTSSYLFGVDVIGQLCIFRSLTLEFLNIIPSHLLRHEKFLSLRDNLCVIILIPNAVLIPNFPSRRNSYFGKFHLTNLYFQISHLQV